jgi:hypothetical protein
MKITLHENKSQWKHAVPLKALVGYGVVVITEEDVIEGELLALTDDDFAIVEQITNDDEVDTYAISLFDIQEIKYC